MTVTDQPRAIHSVRPQPQSVRKSHKTEPFHSPGLDCAPNEFTASDPVVETRTGQQNGVPADEMR